MDISIPVPWGVVAAKTLGSSDNFPVLCLHGWQDNLCSFNELIPFLPKDKFYVFIDLPGHGFSSPLPIGCFPTFYEYAATIERIRRYFNWNMFSIIGHSLGGNIAGLYCATFPEKVDKVIIMDAHGLVALQEKNIPRYSRNAVEGLIKAESLLGKEPPTYTYEEAKSRLLKASWMTRGLTDKGADILLERGLKKVSDGRYIFNRDTRVRERRLDSTVISCMTKGLVRTLASKVTAEVLHVKFASSVSLMTTLKSKGRNDYADFVLESYTNSEHHEIVTVEGGHHGHLCQPEFVAPEICRFLQRPLRKGLLASQDTKTISKL